MLPYFGTENPPFLWRVGRFLLDFGFCIAHEKPVIILKILAGASFWQPKSVYPILSRKQYGENSHERAQKGIIAPKPY